MEKVAETLIVLASANLLFSVGSLVILSGALNNIKEEILNNIKEEKEEL